MIAEREIPVKINGTQTTIRRERPRAQAQDAPTVRARPITRTRTVTKTSALVRLAKVAVVGCVCLGAFHMMNGFMGCYMLTKTRSEAAGLQKRLSVSRSLNQALQATVDRMSAPRQIAEWAEANNMQRVGSMMSLRPAKDETADRGRAFAMVGGKVGD